MITNYGAINTCYSTLGKIKWEVIVVDEAHKIKNYESKVSQCMRCYQASFKLLLTGTPLSNNLCELWSLLNFIMPDLFDDENIFN